MIQEVGRRLFLFLLRWRIKMRHFPRWLSVISAAILLVACAAPFWRQVLRLVKSHDASVWVDVALGTALLAVIPFILAAYGGHVAAETINDPRQRRNVKLKFWGLCLIGVLLAFLQQYRSITEENKNERKNDTAQGQIISMLTDLHGTKGVLTEAERRRKILDILRERYILTHDVDQNLIDGTEPPPADWVNVQLKGLGENWAVAPPPTTPSPVSPRSRTYLAEDGPPRFTGSNPANQEGMNFQPGDPLGFNIYHRVSGPNAIDLGGVGQETVLVADSNPETLEGAYKLFAQRMAEDMKKAPNQGKSEWRQISPGTSHFITAVDIDRDQNGNNTMHRLTQNELDKLKSGGLIAVVMSVFKYKDGNQLHHLWVCYYLQTPSQPPGIWHSFRGCPSSD